jgi:hypothetical protein
MIEFKVAARGLVAMAAAALACAGAAQAEPLKLKPGPVELATTGLVIDIPSKPETTFKLTGSWSMNAVTNTFDSRDVIDEFKTATDRLVAGNWVMTGFFDAGDCTKVLAGETIDNAWSQHAKLWGTDWQVRGGVHDLGGSIGKAPTVMLCRTDAKGRALLLYRYLIDQPLTLDQLSMMKQTEAADILQQAWKSYRDNRTADVFTTRRLEINRRGEGLAQRTVKLSINKLSLQLPDDGFVWLAREGDGSDMIDRMAPSLPDVSVEVAVAEKATCQEVFDSLKDNRRPNHKAKAAPAGWLIGESMMIDGETELMLCRTTSYGSLMAGVIQGGDRTDIASLFPILNALAQSSRTP